MRLTAPGRDEGGTILAADKHDETRVGVQDARVTERVVDNKPTLYGFQTCPFCWKVRSLLNWKGVEYSSVEVDPMTKAEIRWANWKSVPVFVDADGTQVNDSNSILHYVDEKLGGVYRPDVWERRLVYYLRRDPEASAVAELDGRVVGFMLGEVRSGEFGLEEPTGWIEVMGVDPAVRGQSIGRRLADHLFDHFRSRDAATVRTLVDEGMAGISGFFAALGFEPANLRPFVKKL